MGFRDPGLCGGALGAVAAGKVRASRALPAASLVCTLVACLLEQPRPRDGHHPLGTHVRAGDTPLSHLGLSRWLLQRDGKGAAGSPVGGEGGLGEEAVLGALT